MNAVPDRDIISYRNPPVPSTKDVQRRILKAQAAIQETDYDFLEHLSSDSPDDIADVISFDEFPELDQRSLQDYIWIGRIEAALKIPEHLKEGGL